jgi:mannosyltransferase OCH1-like enzyme
MIPKIIHHVWPGDDPFKEKFHNFRNSWMKHHPDWTFYFWRLDNLPQHINSDTLNVAKDSKFSVTVRSDVLRFEILRLYGGIYVDTDMECLKPFDEFLNLDFFTGYEDDVQTACPSLIGSVPNYSLITEVSRISVDNAKNLGHEKSNKAPNNITGVLPFSNTVKKFIKNTNISVFDKNYFYPVSYTNREKLSIDTPLSYAKHYWSGMDSDGWTKVQKF